MATLEREMHVAKTLEALKPLMKEFIARIEKIGDSAFELFRFFLDKPLLPVHLAWMRTELANLNDTFKRIRPDAEDVDRRASGLVEHAGLDEMDRWELLLRLAELESAIRTTQARLSAALPILQSR
jgi:hypothetical protein